MIKSNFVSCSNENLRKSPSTIVHKSPHFFLKTFAFSSSSSTAVIGTLNLNKGDMKRPSPAAGSKIVRGQMRLDT